MVLDIDPRNGGLETLENLVAKHGELPHTPKCITGRGDGGYHLYFAYFERAKNCSLGDGIDFLADGKQACAPPSVHPDTGCAYRWETPPTENEDPAELPERWIQLLRGEMVQRKDIEQLFTLPDETIKVGSRNSTLFDLGRRALRSGESKTKVAKQLREANATLCEIPLDTKELEAMIAKLNPYKSLGKTSLLTQWQDAVWNTQLPKTRKLVLQALGSFADTDSGRCYPNVDQIASRASLTKPPVIEHLKIANDEGWFVRWEVPRPDGQIGFSWSYKLKLKEP